MDETIFKEGIPLLKGRLRLKVSQDGMEAALFGDDVVFDFSEVRDLDLILQEQGITSGILPSPEILEDRVVIARGTPSVHGEDGRIELIYSDEVREGLEERGVSDPRETNFIINVREGEVVARRIPPTKGTPGMDVFGREVPAEPGKWVAFKLGQGVEIDEDGDELLASVSGKLAVDDEGTISILEEYTIDGSVDWSTGNVTFVGRLLRITGDVKPGFSVSVEHDLIIEGSVEDGARIKVEGNLEIKGIIRAKGTRIEVGGDLECTTIEYARVSVRGDMEVHDYLLDAECMVGGHVGLIGGKGTMAGGKLVLGRSLVAKVLGSPAYVYTEISAGYDPEITRLYKTTLKEIKMLTEKRLLVGETMMKFSDLRAKRKLKPDIEHKVEKLKVAYQSLAAMLQEKREFLQRCEEEIGQRERAAITVLETVYPNTALSIAGVSHLVKEELHEVRFGLHAGSIKVSKLSRGEY